MGESLWLNFEMACEYTCRRYVGVSAQLVEAIAHGATLQACLIDSKEMMVVHNVGTAEKARDAVAEESGLPQIRYSGGKADRCRGRLRRLMAGRGCNHY